MLIKPSIFSAFPQVSAGMSMRTGGISEAPYASLNLGKSTADSPEAVLENRRRFFGELGFEVSQVALSGQTHSCEVRHIVQPDFEVGFDAMMCDRSGVCVAVTVADCCPIMVFDATNNAVASIHAGWKGSCGGIVRETLHRMAAAYGTKGEDCFAYIGPCISEDNFEVGPEVAERFDEIFVMPGHLEDKFYVNLKAVNASFLRAFGVPPQQIEVSPLCTVRNNDMFFSHRADGGTTGRMMAAIGLLP